MAQVTAVAEAAVAAPPADVIAALADYTTTRPAILTDRYTDYAVLEGGTGSGTVATWRLHATEKRVRHVVADVTVDATSVVEKDRNSTLVTRFDVASSGAGGSTVTATTTWQGAGGIGGFFERTFAPKGLRRIHEELLGNLAARLAA